MGTIGRGPLKGTFFRRNRGLGVIPQRRNQTSLAGGGGFEPPSATPKAAVLPLDDPPVVRQERKPGTLGVPVKELLPVTLREGKQFVRGPSGVGSSLAGAKLRK